MNTYKELKIPRGLNSNTAELIVHFAQAIAEKLYAAQQKYGYSDNWRRPDWEDECRAELLRHIAKGDPRDVAAYCAFLWYHGKSTNNEQASQPQSLPELEAGISAVIEPMLREELQDLQATFDLRWKADMRAIAKWREKTGKELMMPDHTDLCVWLLEQLEQSSQPQKRFPMQRGPDIDWTTAEKIYAIYSALYGKQQSLERLAERGGFSWPEVEVIFKEGRKQGLTTIR